MIKLRVPDLSLQSVLLIVIGLTCLLVALSYLIYLNDANYKYDIARPGDKSRSKELSVSENEVSDTTSPVDEDALQEKIFFLEAEVNNLNQLNGFDGKPVSDRSMQLDPEASSGL